MWISVLFWWDTEEFPELLGEFRYKKKLKIKNCVKSTLIRETYKCRNT